MPRTKRYIKRNISDLLLERESALAYFDRPDMAAPGSMDWIADINAREIVLLKELLGVIADEKKKCSLEVFETLSHEEMITRASIEGLTGKIFDPLTNDFS